MKKQKNGAARKRKPSTGARLALAIVTMVNLALTLALSIARRQQVLRAINEDGQVKLLLEKTQETK